MIRHTLARIAIASVSVAVVIAVVMSCSRSGSNNVSPTATSHEGSEGLVLSPATGESVIPGGRCIQGAPVRDYRIAAINVEISLNRYMDYDPQGRMYVLEHDIARVRDEEARNRRARAEDSEPAVSIGLQGDAIQPLVLRVNQGDCLRVTLRNDLRNGEPASFHLHASGLVVSSTGGAAIATNPHAIAVSGQSVTYEWMVSENQPEGSHNFHSHGDDRWQSSHGLFGAVIVESKGATYLDPLTGSPLQSGWSAIVRGPSGDSFREFVIFYHEIGDESFILLDKNSRPIPQVDPFTTAYRPASRAMNYRSEPFMNRLGLQQQEMGFADKSQAYSSYTFGDPATPIARSYLGDPVKERILHSGSEVSHVHHVHGGAIRWRRQPGAEPRAIEVGLTKRPQLLPDVSERVDSQSIGPSESYDLENECGSGGCQQSVGDYLIHCHIAHHYIAGMWMIWRVYNTLQDGAVSQDTLPPLRELPGREGLVRTAVTSDALIGTTVDWMGQVANITAANLDEWVERQLPPPGVPKAYDASVLDWEIDGLRYLNEPETARSWPGYSSANAGERMPLHFDPLTGKLAYPFLRPHLGKRPPFAPNHGPAPFLDPTASGADPPAPGADGPWSLCPSGTTVEEFVIHAINLPIALNQRLGIVDPVGQLFVLKEDEAQVRRDNGLKVPLALRANAGEHCVDIIFKSELQDTPENGFFSKANVHVHFMQFDVQASDGVSAGFNYEQSVRPFAIEGETLSQAATVGSLRIALSSAARFQPGVVVGVGMDQADTFEIRRIARIEANTLVFDKPLSHAHASGEIVSTEFVRYRWYPDVQFGTAYFHDHVDALSSWKHGLFGALVSEPPGSTYHDPYTGEPLRSGPIADIHTTNRVSADLTGSFREFVLFIQDDNPLTRTGRSSGGSFNLRVEPLDRRSPEPETPLFEALVGDPLVIRGLVSGTNEIHTFHLDGHWFRMEPHSLTSPPIDTIAIGISERFDLVVPAAGGPQSRPGDYLYYNGRLSKLREGNWGIMRVHDGGAATPLQKLPGQAVTSGATGSVCPSDAPVKRFDIAAIDVLLPMLGGFSGKVYVLQRDRRATLEGATKPVPLILRVNVGDCIAITLTNETTGGPVSFHANMLAYDPSSQRSIGPGRTGTFTFYASPEVGETIALVRDCCDNLTQGGPVVENVRLGLYGAIVVGPRGALYTDPVGGADISASSSWRADVRLPSGERYRDFVLLMHDEDEIIGTHQMPYTDSVQGTVAINYAAEPLERRLRRDPNPSRVFDSAIHGDPSTPLLEAFAGDAVRIHVLLPVSEQAHVFTVEAHLWPIEPGLAGGRTVSSQLVAALQTLGVRLIGGASNIPGDYLYGDHREPYREAGLWGLLRVYPRGASGTGLRSLDGS